MLDDDNNNKEEQEEEEEDFTTEDRRGNKIFTIIDYFDTHFPRSHNIHACLKDALYHELETFPVFSYMDYPLQQEWTPPDMFAKDVECLALNIKLTILLQAVDVIRCKYKIDKLDIQMNKKAKDKQQEADNAYDKYINMVRNKAEHIKMINLLYEQIDSYMKLMCAMEYIALTSDDTIENVESIYKLIPPDTKYSLTPDKLPKLIPLVLLSIMYAFNDINTERLIKKRFPEMTPYNFSLLVELTTFMHKIVPNRSNIREAHESVQTECNKGDLFAEIMYKILVSSCLGIYDTSITKMSLDRRVKLYNVFYRGTPIQEVYNTFDAKTTMMLIYAGKEYYTYMIDMLPSFKKTMKEAYNWKAYELFMFLGCEEFRQNGGFDMEEACLSESGRLSFNAAGGDIIGIHERFCPLQYKSNINYNIKTIIHVCTGLNYTRYKLPSTNSLVPGKLTGIANPHMSLPPEDMEIMRRIISLFDYNVPVPFSWLVYFGVPADTLTGLQIAVYAKRPFFKKFMMLLPMDAYTVIYNFFNLCNSRDSFLEYKSDAHMYMAHYKATLKNFDLKDGDEFPAVAGKIQVCENCKNIKHVSSFSKDVSIKASGSKGKVMVMSDNTVVCACKPQNIPWTEKYKAEHGEPPPSVHNRRKLKIGTESTRKRKMAKNIAMRLLYNKCQLTPTRTIDLLGKMSIFWSVCRLACMDDQRVCTLESMKYHGDRVLCKTCYMKRRYPPQPTQELPLDLLLKINEITKPTGMELVFLHQPSGEIEPIMPPTPVQNEGELVVYNKEKAKAGIRGRKARNIVDPCEYCGKETHPDKRRTFNLYDDVAAIPTFRNMHFCYAHGALYWIVTHSYTHKSAVINSIHENLHTSDDKKWKTRNK